MPAKIKSDTLAALADWQAGKPVRGLELGHVYRMKEHPGLSPLVDRSQRVDRDQERAYAYCFYLVDCFKLNGVPAEHEDFLKACEDYDCAFPEVDNLTEEEELAAQSLVWKALLVGWRKAIDGHSEASYIEVKRETVSAT
jgi:hypothetical protein